MILVFLVVILTSYHFSVREILSTTTEYQKENLMLVSEELSNKLSNYNEISVGISRQEVFRKAITGSDDPFIRRNLFSSLSRDFSNMVFSFPDFHSFEVYMNNPPTNFYHYPIFYYSMENINSKKWVNHLENTTTAWLGERKVAMTNQNESVISLGRNIYSPRGDIEAVLLLNLHSSVIEEWLNREVNKSNLLLLDVNASIIASSSSLPLTEELFYHVKETVFDLQGQRGGIRQQDLREGEHIVVASSIPRSNWTLVEITSYEELTKASKLMASILAMIGVASIGVALVVTWFLTKKFTEPINYLTRVLSKFPQKNVSNELPFDYKNEFGLLFNGYRELMNRSERLYESLIEQHQRQREAEMKALQANINPHFLYNTLDQLNWSAIERGDEEMSRMLELLGKMLRIGLSKGESILTIDDELKYLEYYLQIQRIQMEDRLTFTIDVPPHIRECYIPKLTFQPFVENAIIHGFHESRHGHIHLTGKEYEESFIFMISDNGQGIQQSLSNPDKEKIETGGYGIFNVKERLDVYYGKQASVKVSNRQEGGVVVSIRLPKDLEKNIMKFQGQKKRKSFNVNENIRNRKLDNF